MGKVLTGQILAMTDPRIMQQDAINDAINLAPGPLMLLPADTALIAVGACFCLHPEEHALLRNRPKSGWQSTGPTCAFCRPLGQLAKIVHYFFKDSPGSLSRRSDTRL